MRVLRLIFGDGYSNGANPRGADHQCRLFPEHGRTNVIQDWPAWWNGIRQIANPVRRDFSIRLALSGCRGRGKHERWQVDEHRSRHLGKTPISKTTAFEMPISNSMIELLHNRIADNAEESARTANGSSHRSRQQPATREAFEPPPNRSCWPWFAHTLRHSSLPMAAQEPCPRLVNHKPKRAQRRNAPVRRFLAYTLMICACPQQRMTDYLLALMERGWARATWLFKGHMA